MVPMIGTTYSNYSGPIRCCEITYGLKRYDNGVVPQCLPGVCPPISTCCLKRLHHFCKDVIFLVHDVAASKIACARPPLKWSSRSSIPQRASAFRRGAGGPGIGGQTHMIRLIITPFALVGFG